MARLLRADRSDAGNSRLRVSHTKVDVPLPMRGKAGDIAKATDTIAAPLAEGNNYLDMPVDMPAVPVFDAMVMLDLT